MSAIIIDRVQSQPFADGDTYIYIRAIISCDTVADLPAPDYFTNYYLTMDSVATVIETAETYKMKSDGTWVLQASADLSYIISTISDILPRLSDTETDIATLQTVVNDKIKPALAAVINDGAKNKLNVTATTTTINGIAFTINADGTLTVDGINPDKKATGNIYFQLGNVDISTGESIHLSGCPAGGSYANSFAFYIDYTGGSTLAYDDGNGATYTATESRTLRCRIIIRNGTIIDNLTFSPMICYQDYYNITQDFRIYAPTNRQLFEMI